MNRSRTDIVIGSVELLEGEGDFMWGGGCRGVRLAPLETCKAGFTFLPHKDGFRSAQVVFEDKNGRVIPSGFVLTGYGAEGGAFTCAFDEPIAEDGSCPEDHEGAAATFDSDFEANGPGIDSGEAPSQVVFDANSGPGKASFDPDFEGALQAPNLEGFQAPDPELSENPAVALGANAVKYSRGASDLFEKRHSPSLPLAQLLAATAVAISVAGVFGRRRLQSLFGTGEGDFPDEPYEAKKHRVGGFSRLRGKGEGGHGNVEVSNPSFSWNQWISEMGAPTEN